ncbi:DNA-processing protein DprA [Nonomuraea guangzhouensis]|uniref:DNA-processing protein DprA n=1 Tax=Nonomuraea guangzhouensis TaxID=1291555 RepID=A0ABW4GEI6_9ACTN|nr:DNA-processing protein DprA [Nonomuraea guangzhouensis]
MPLAAAITGTRSTGHREPTWFADLFGTYLGPFATEDAHFNIGGAVGIDSLSLLWLAGNSKSRITIVVPGTVEQQPAEARQAIAQCRDRIAEITELRATEVQTQAYHARNRWMVDRAALVIGFPLEGAEDTSGTWQTINYGASQGKPRLIVPV